MLDGGGRGNTTQAGHFQVRAQEKPTKGNLLKSLSGFSFLFYAMGIIRSFIDAKAHFLFNFINSKIGMYRLNGRDFPFLVAHNKSVLLLITEDVFLVQGS